MEVDEDVDSSLLRQFNCLGTTDKDVLVRQLQSLVGIHLSEKTARFYLDMADWNIQAAVCAYFDLQAGNRLPQMTFVKDITIGEGESVPPNTRFIKTWRIRNSGENAWPGGCQLIFTGGEKLAMSDRVSVGPLMPGCEVDVSIEMCSPAETGLYSSKWRMSTLQGNFFGDIIWVIIQVDSGGTLGLMQQMFNFKELGSSPEGSSESNPFAPNSNPSEPPQLATEEELSLLRLNKSHRGDSSSSHTPSNSNFDADDSPMS